MTAPHPATPLGCCRAGALDATAAALPGLWREVGLTVPTPVTRAAPPAACMWARFMYMAEEEDEEEECWEAPTCCLEDWNNIQRTRHLL